MRRALAVLAALVLVNLPLVDQWSLARELDARGRDVDAELVDARRVGERSFVDFRLPRRYDERRATQSARLDDAAYDRARATRRVPVRVVPGDPSSARPVGAVGSPLVPVVAVVADLALGAVVAITWWRRRARSRHRVLAVDGDELVLEVGRRELRVLGPPGWAAGRRPADRVTGDLSLLAASDVVPGLPLHEVEALEGARCLVRGRVRDARRGRVTLVVEDLVLPVETGPHRVRVDLRESAEVSGTLRLTPRGRRA